MINPLLGQESFASQYRPCHDLLIPQSLSQESEVPRPTVSPITPTYSLSLEVTRQLYGNLQPLGTGKTSIKTERDAKPGLRCPGIIEFYNGLSKEEKED